MLKPVLLTGAEVLVEMSTSMSLLNKQASQLWVCGCANVVCIKLSNPNPEMFSYSAAAVLCNVAAELSSGD